MSKNDNAHSLRLTQSIANVAIFARVFRKPVYTTLLESIKTGGDRCVIQVEW